MDTKKLQYKPKGQDVYYSPLKYWVMEGNTVVGIYQGNRGENPDLDFIVKYKEEGKRLRTPSHTHWIVDLLVKSEKNKGMVRDFVVDMIEIYNQVQPFQTTQQRDEYELIYPKLMSEKYQEINDSGYYKIDTLTTLIELFSMCEKQTTGAFMFLNLLKLIQGYTEGEKDFYQIVGYSKRV
jgi:hypothetical protein